MATKGFVCDDHNASRHLDGKEPRCLNCGKTRQGYEPIPQNGGSRYVPNYTGGRITPDMR